MDTSASSGLVSAFKQGLEYNTWNEIQQALARLAQDNTKEERTGLLIAAKDRIDFLIYEQAIRIIFPTIYYHLELEIDGIEKKKKRIVSFKATCFRFYVEEKPVAESTPRKATVEIAPNKKRERNADQIQSTLEDCDQSFFKNTTGMELSQDTQTSVAYQIQLAETIYKEYLRLAQEVFPKKNFNRDIPRAKKTRSRSSKPGSAAIAKNCKLKNQSNLTVVSANIYPPNFNDKINERLTILKEEITSIPHFTGRCAEMEQINCLFSRTRRVVIRGPGGVGKTQLSRRFAEQSKDKYEFIYQLHGSNQNSLEESLHELANYLEIPTLDNGKLRFKSLKISLTKTAFVHALILLDGIEQIELSHNLCIYLDYFPKAWHILLTSRLEDTSTTVDALELSLTEGLEPDEATQYLLDFTNQSDRQSAQKIAERLYNFPLALAHAAGTMKNKMAMSKYYSLLKDLQIQANTNIQVPGNYKHTIHDTWLINLKIIKQKQQGLFAVKLMEFISICNTKKFQTYILKLWLKQYLPKDKDTLSETLSLLCGYSLLEYSEGYSDSTYVIHPLLQEVIREYLAKEKPESLNELQTQKRNLLAQIELNQEKTKSFGIQESINQIPRLTAYITQLLGDGKDAKSLELIQELYQFYSTEAFYEPLRIACVEAIQPHPLANELAKQPNQLTGYRVSYRLSYAKLKKHLDSLTTYRTEEAQHPLGFKVKLTTMQWAQGELLPSLVLGSSDLPAPVTSYLKPAIIDQILNVDQIQNYIARDTSEVVLLVKRKHPESLHRVAEATNDDVSLHFKERPTHPCMEFAATSLMHRLFGGGAVPVVLAKMTVEFKDGRELTTAVLISLTARGRSLSDLNERSIAVLKKRAQFSEMLISQLLLLPGDAHKKDFILTKEPLVCIDNEACFIPVKKPGSNEILFNSAIFRLGEGRLSSKVTQEFCKWDPHFILADWLNELLHIDKEWSALFQEDREELSCLIYDPCDSYRDPFTNQPRDLNCIVNLILPQGAVARLYYQVLRLQQFFKECPEPTYTELLHQIITCWENETKPGGIAKLIVKQYEKNIPNLPSLTRPSSITWKQLLDKVPTIGEIDEGIYTPKNALEELTAIQCFFKAEPNMDEQIIDTFFTCTRHPSDTDVMEIRKGIRIDKDKEMSRKWLFLQLLLQVAGLECLIKSYFNIRWSSINLINDITLQALITNNLQSLKFIELNSDSKDSWEILASALPQSNIRTLIIAVRWSKAEDTVKALAEKLCESNLMYLVLESSFTSIGIKAIAKNLPGSKIIKLALTTNSEGRIPENIELQEEAIAALAESLPKSNLTHLSLSGHYLGFGLVEILKYLPESNITHLSLSGHYLGFGVEILKYLPESNIACLVMNYTRSPENADNVSCASKIIRLWEYFPEGFSKIFSKAKLKTLNISNIIHTNELMNVLMYGLILALPQSSVTHLDFHGNKLVNTRLCELASILSSSSITHLTIGNREEHDDFHSLTLEGLKALNKALGSSKIISLQLINVGYKCKDEIEKMRKKHHQITIIELTIYYPP